MGNVGSLRAEGRAWGKHAAGQWVLKKGSWRTGHPLKNSVWLNKYSGEEVPLPWPWDPKLHTCLIPPRAVPCCQDELCHPQPPEGRLGAPERGGDDGTPPLSPAGLGTRLSCWGRPAPAAPCCRVGTSVQGSVLAGHGICPFRSGAAPSAPAGTLKNERAKLLGVV